MSRAWYLVNIDGNRSFVPAEPLKNWDHRVCSALLYGIVLALAIFIAASAEALSNRTTATMAL